MRAGQALPHPTDAARVVAALSCPPELPRALYDSRDQGASWSPWGSWPEGESGGSRSVAGPLVLGGAGGLPARFYAAFTVHSPEGGLPLYRTDDTGATWRSEMVGPRSADGGATWTALALPSELRNVAAVALGVDRRNLYVATTYGTYANGAEGVYRVPLGGP